ncbi:MAG: metallophosphoesterase [Actinobacteria bacterium]|nr:metallophosphoesterase [Actinomycetota bacterium]
MAKSDKRFLIAQISDLHCGDLRFDHNLMAGCIEIVNAEEPDLTVIAGDLTVEGYREQYDEARSYIDLISCPNKVVIAGNHDCRNVGYIHFEELFGPRTSTIHFTHSGGCGKDLSEHVTVVAVDSNKPDVNDGEVGRHNFRFIESEFAGDATFKIFILHHHLVHIPGTGRERNIVWDAGDVLHVLREMHVDIVLSGHKHVPYVWPLARMYLITSGTVSTWRTRGRTTPSFNLIQIEGDEITVNVISSADGSRRSQTYPRWWCHERFSAYEQ